MVRGGQRVYVPGKKSGKTKTWETNFDERAVSTRVKFRREGVPTTKTKGVV